ncbi:MAG TPA: amino acid ABC transporter ATP-binding protein [Acidobacteriota bacterium]|nr:amino acid ABC transporter ATP-binding protein [Acidobacteriota bacterium]
MSDGSTGNQPALVARAISKRYGDLVALDRVDLTIDVSEVVVFVGPSGGGKSTLLRCLNGLESVDEGTIEIDSVRLDAQSDSADAVRANTGMVFQQFNLFPHLNALDNVALAPRIVRGIPRAGAREQAQRQLERVGLGDKLSAYPAELSGGQQQRVAIARALAMEPKVMLFDEPTSALDTEMIGEVLAVMKTLADEGMTMAIVSHEIRFVREVADRVAFLESGRIVVSGTPDEMLTNPTHPRLIRFIKKVV